MKLLDKIRRSKHIKRVFIITGFVFMAFALVNLILGYIYHNRTYPGTVVQSQRVGSTSRDTLSNNLGSLNLLPESLKFEYQDTTSEVNTSELGITLNKEETAKQAVKQKSWLPILNFISPPKVGVEVSVNQGAFDDRADSLAETFTKKPNNAKVELKDGKFVVIKEADGYELDEPELLSAVQMALASNSTTVVVPVKITPPEVKESDLAGSAQDLSERTNVAITYKFKDKTHKLTPVEISSLHEPNDTNYVLSEAKIRDFIIRLGKNWGIGVQNIVEVTRDTKSAIQNKTNKDFSLVEAPRKNYNYCVALRGVDGSELSGFQNKINSVLNDDRGWSLNGQVSFNKVDSGCGFTVWLSAANQMSSFGAICDSQWSCAVSPSVVINYDRWKGASSAWNQSGGSLEDYRAMVINHETGHWLGFGHRNCGGAGQPAPVMQQQSIDLQGCKFNSWPLAVERDTLKKNLGI